MHQTTRTASTRQTARGNYGIIIAVVLALGAGFGLGVYRQQIVATMASMVGIPASGETIDTTQLQHTYQKLLAHYDGTLDDQALIDGASRGMVEAVGDDYTTYLDAEEAKQFQDDLSGSIGGGIGAQVGQRDNVITFVKILDKTPAQTAGLLAGDRVLAINDETTKGMSVDTAVSKIRGEVGTTVKLSVLRGDAPLQEFTVTRAEITAPSVESSQEGDIGIITVSRFDQSTGRDAREAARRLQSSGVRGIVLDLRGNPGGFVTAAQDLAGIWLDGQVVVSERRGGKVVEELRSSSSPILTDMPTVVLVDGGSASASEIVAGALRDHKKATLVGETTYGKGTVQQLVTLSEGALLKVTVARWYTPGGVNLSDGGLKPDVEAPISADDIRAGNDTQLRAALERLAR